MLGALQSAQASVLALLPPALTMHSLGVGDGRRDMTSVLRSLLYMGDSGWVLPGTALSGFSGHWGVNQHHVRFTHLFLCLFTSLPLFHSFPLPLFLSAFLINTFLKGKFISV